MFSFSDTATLASSQFVKLLAATPSQVLERITGPEGRELTAQLNGLGEDEVSGRERERERDREREVGERRERGREGGRKVQGGSEVMGR